MLWLLSVLAGCCVPQDWIYSSPQGPFSGPLDVRKVLPIRERQYILPGFDSSPARPEPIVSSSNCEDLEEGGPVGGPGCVTRDLQCGDTVVGHTVGGVRRLDSKFYEKKFCTPFTTNHDGGEERVYRLVMPQGEWKAFVWLDSPCADLDLFAVLHDGEDCPTLGHNIPRCEAGVMPGTKEERVELVSQGESTWFLVVEGKGEEEGPFGLHVQCRPGLQ